MGKLTARERIERLFDPGTFQEIDLWIDSIKTGFDIDREDLPGDGVIIGYGDIEGRPVYAYAHDFTVAGGTFGATLHHKVTRLMEMALEKKVPYVHIVDSAGERIHDWFGIPAHRPILAGKHPIGGAMTMYRSPGLISGVVPQITLMLGPMYAGSAYVPTMSDFMIMRNKTAFMSVASPSLLKAVTFQEVTQEEIGGAELHATVTGTADFLTETDEEAIEICRRLITYMPSHCRETPPRRNPDDDPHRKEDRLLEIDSRTASAGYDMHEVILSVVDRGSFLELQGLFAQSLIIGLARFDGETVGIVANNPGVDNGILTIDTCDKQARFIRWCDAFNVPMLFFVDTPGFLASREQEQSREGLIRTAPKPFFSICEASVPMISVHVGQCFGIARMIMGTPRMGIDLAYAWPSARVARVDPDEAVDCLYGDAISDSEDPDVARREKRRDLLDRYMTFPFHAAQKAMVHDIIDPRETRPVLISSLKRLGNKRITKRPWRKHSLAPQ
jgi:acetyl-CoA carboxylase carboxyltransferase component